MLLIASGRQGKIATGHLRSFFNFFIGFHIVQPLVVGAMKALTVKHAHFGYPEMAGRDMKTKPGFSTGSIYEQFACRFHRAPPSHYEITIITFNFYYLKLQWVCQKIKSVVM